MNVLAALCSFILPGLGQLVKGELFKAIFCFVLTVLGYLAFILPGILIHLIVVLDACSETRAQRKQRKMLEEVYLSNQIRRTE